MSSKPNAGVSLAISAGLASVLVAAILVALKLWALGGTGALSIADFAILGWAWRHERHKVDLADFPNVKRWYDALMARPGVQRGFAVPLRHAA